MTIPDALALLRDLADDPSEFLSDKSGVAFARHGQTVTLNLKHVPRVGICVQHKTQDLPLEHYIQSDILELPRLATQIAKALRTRAKDRPGRYVEPPLDLNGSEKRGSDLTRYLSEPDPFATRLIELSAPAGQGKTILLEELSLQSALAYQPCENPPPLLLVVDLLGRFVGNVDDAIAGALANTYRMPGLSQRDVVLALKKRWLILALDGFDELAARVGLRDAFLRLRELVDQLEGSGTLIVSGRDTFFHSYQSDLARRAYLTPQGQGGYELAPLTLRSWGQREALSVFELLGSPSPAGDLSLFLDVFREEAAIVMQPFFLTRMAALWVNGERFENVAGDRSSLMKKQHLIDVFIAREKAEKWVARSGDPILTVDGHRHLLAGIAGEMWLTGAFRLTQAELEIACELALADSPLETRDAARARIATHAALTAVEGGVVFRHEQFFSYFLGLRLAELLASGGSGLLTRVLGERELSPEQVEWAAHFAAGEARASTTLAAVAKAGADVARLNVGRLLAGGVCGSLRGVSIEGVLFGGALSGVDLSGAILSRCVFHSCEFRGCVARESVFTDCEIIECVLDATTVLQGATFNECRFTGMEWDGRRMYEPAEIVRVLKALGSTMRPDPESHPAVAPTQAPRLTGEVADVLNWIVRRSSRSTDIAEEDFEGDDRILRKLIVVGTSTGVFKKMPRKATSGSHRNFFRIAVDRAALMPGFRGDVARDPRVESFFQELEKL